MKSNGNIRDKKYRMENEIHSKIFIGIDPGKNGGIAYMYRGKIDAFKCPIDSNLMAELFESISRGQMCRVIIEKVHSFPGQGVVSMFSFGQNFGRWEGILSSFSVYYEYVEPKKWQKHYEIKEKDKKKRKLLLKELAQSVAPDLKITYAISDAILLANYCLEKQQEI